MSAVAATSGAARRPLAGRATELAQLRARLAGDGGLIYLHGESGVGKSALARELVHGAIAEGKTAVILFLGNKPDRPIHPRKGCFRAFTGGASPPLQHLLHHGLISDDGQWTGEYKFSDEVQPVFDRRIQRSMNPDQAYQMPPEMQQLQQALMQRRLAGPPPLRAIPERTQSNIVPPPRPEGFPPGYAPRPEGGYG